MSLTLITRNVLYILCCVSLFVSCSSEKDPDEILKTLKPGQAKILIQFDGKPFYTKESIFSGEITAFDNAFRMNLFDQFESNVIISFSGSDWYSKHPIAREVFIDNQVKASAMIGKLIDPVNRRGEGYLMTDGKIVIESFSEEKLVMRLFGQAGQYSNQHEPARWNRLKGLIVYKKPKLFLTNLDKKKLFY